MKRSLIYLFAIAFLIPCSAETALGAITVTSPNGGENWLAGTSQTISWTYEGDPGSAVKIELFDGSTLASTITASTSTGSGVSGSYVWRILSNQTTGSNYNVKITSISNTSVSDSSNNPFAITCHCGTPPFIASDVKPNVLIILDNSNSMDEDFIGEAVGSYSAASKSVAAKQALQQFATQLKDRLRIGLMTYKLPTDIGKRYLHNAAYFASFEPKSYCPNPARECVEYCQTGDDAKKTVCLDSCTTDNPIFDPTYLDEIISGYSAGSEQRNRYCSLVYPKTKRKPNPTDPSNYYYYKNAHPYYDSGNRAIGFYYSPAYNPGEGSPWDSYKRYTTKTGTEDDANGYSGYQADVTFQATDTDFALGYKDFGRRMPYYYVNRSWFGESSPGEGYLHVPINDLSTTVNEVTTTTATYDVLMDKLAPKTNDETDYMYCTDSDKNLCKDSAGKYYIINAGLTPTAGTLQTAINYFKGTLSGTTSPISVRCQKNFVVYVTDGLPSISETGTADTADALMPKVLKKLSSLRNDITKTFPDPRFPNNRNKDITYHYDVKSYILGVGLSNEAKSKLDTMAVSGGTDVDGRAYYADDAAKLVEALNQIFSDILTQTSSGTSVSILSEKAQQGANMMQAVFYPAKKFGDLNVWVDWTGFLYNYWFYVSKAKSNLREDTNKNNILDLQYDCGLTFDFNESTGLTVTRSQDTNADGDPDSIILPEVTLDEISPLWEAGKILAERSETGINADPRKIYTVSSSNELVEFDPAHLASFSSMLGNAGSFADCLTGADDTATYTNLINYIRGIDITECRNRSYTVREGNITNTYTWKLGDIVYSTPKVASDYPYCYDSSTQQFSSTPCTTDLQCTTGSYTQCKKKESVVFVGANDGMLHAFQTGVLNKSDLLEGQVAKLEGTDFGKELWAFIPKNALPYLRCLAETSYCHLSYIDLSPHIVEMGDKKVLIGGMRLGGASTKNNVGTFSTGAPSDTCPSVSCADANTCYNPSTCIGLSSYFALDITDVESPKLLWEFSHPLLGYSYSGPAVIHRLVHPTSGPAVDKYFVMFLSGPIERNGSSNQNVKAFILSLDDQLKISSSNGLYVKDLGNSTQNGFGGRLFTNGMDVDEDGYTDFVLFGFSYSASGQIDDWKGGIVKLWTGDDDLTDSDTEPGSWDFDLTYFNAAQQPVTAKVEFSKCFNQWYVFASTGRYFFKEDQYSTQQSDWIMGVPFVCDANNDCDQGSINFGHSSADFCSSLGARNERKGWYWDLERPDPGTGFYKERSITDPTISTQDIVFFTSTEPTTDVCGFGGQSRVWGLNCATGGPISDTSCGSAYTVKTSTGTLYLQTSTGAINPLDPAKSFTENDGKTTGWIPGIPPESAPPLVPPYEIKTGQILHWIEK
ncbi:MAG: hypothetical protein GX433_16060 [Deltaproteobacteria bacterium]|jgi:type IV pilus assembly protein PilY1|nr:hypothetical protein [Deltaproteobacteria bacterium]